MFMNLFIKNVYTIPNAGSLTKKKRTVQITIKGYIREPYTPYSGRRQCAFFFPCLSYKSKHRFEYRPDKSGGA